MENRPLLVGFARWAPRAAACFACALLLASSALAEPVQAGVPDLIGARGLSLGAYRGLVVGNDGIFTNAASLLSRHRYSIETMWLLDRFGDRTALHVYNASAVDTQTSSVGGGLSYTRLLGGPWTGNLFHVPVAFPLTSRLFLGLTAKYQAIDGPGPDEMRAVNLDASAFWQITRLISVGAAGYNLIGSGHKMLQPRAVGVGASIGDDRKYSLSADWRGDLQRKGHLTNLFAVGGEVMLGDSWPLRASFVRDDTRDASFWSVGIGVVTTSGFAVDFGYRQSFQSPTERTFSAAIKLYVQPSGG